jgi:signal recognition particle subunit SRP54
MIPGLSAQFIEKGKEKEGQAKIKRYMTIMDSMTQKGELTQDFLFSKQAGHVFLNLFDSCCLPVELDNTNPKLMNESRINRIARGSGRLVKEVVDMLEEHKRIAKMWSKLPINNIRRPNNRDSLKPLVNALPPNMLNQLGGLNGLQNMMKQMGSQKR